jgi:hypothetical protein
MCNKMKFFFCIQEIRILNANINFTYSAEIMRSIEVKTGKITSIDLVRSKSQKPQKRIIFQSFSLKKLLINTLFSTCLATPYFWV